MAFNQAGSLFVNLRLALALVHRRALGIEITRLGLMKSGMIPT